MSSQSQTPLKVGIPPAQGPESESRAQASARKANLKLTTKYETRVSKLSGGKTRDGYVLAPCIKAYLSRFEHHSGDVVELLDNLTSYLIDTRDETEMLIKGEMQSRYTTDPAKIPSAVANSLKRSAGTNYQALVSYALARYLVRANSSWYVDHPVPKEFSQSLAISFTGGIPVTGDASSDSTPIESLSVPGRSSREIESEAESYSEPTMARVQPDVDVLLRNAGWPPMSGKPEPTVLLSVKTSL
jgi:hypothetical protein